MGDLENLVPLIGYSDRLSLYPGEKIEFKVSSLIDAPVNAWLTRSISADPNPAGIGIVEQECSEFFKPVSFQGRNQPFYPGSYGLSNSSVSINTKAGFEISACIYPTLAKESLQTILSVGPLKLCLQQRCLVLFVGRNKYEFSHCIHYQAWQQITTCYDATTKNICFKCTAANLSELVLEIPVDPSQFLLEAQEKVVVGASLNNGLAEHFFNGKIESPSLVPQSNVVLNWDFSRDISTTMARCNSDSSFDLSLINYPTRAVTSSSWDGSEMCWRHAPDHYAAIHFHETDIYDFEWDTDFQFVCPEDMPSGIYVMHLRCGDHEDAMPFFLCAPKGKNRHKLCLLVSTFTYAVYGNHARPDFKPEWKTRMKEWGAYPYNPAEYPAYGLSTYNHHPDKSGICHGSHLRPLLNLRPGYLTFGYGKSSGLRHFQADSHLVSWLHNKGIEFDIVTDQELHDHGSSAIENYQCLLTGSHPEYHTLQSLDTLQGFSRSGGNLVYLGGNGFYWKVVPHNEAPGLLEIRRAEDGIRAWAAEPGEYYNAFDGSYGGLWRRNGRPPQRLCAVGFSAQGEFNGAAYRRVCCDPNFDWVFDGISQELIGDYGFSGGGAAGFELDRFDERLGSPANTVLLASSEGHGGDFILVPEETLTHLTTWSGEPKEDLIRADMVYCDLDNGGKLFSVGSITFCGSLPWNNFNNDISRLLENVLDHMMKG